MAGNNDILTEKLENTKIEEAEFEKLNDLPPEIKLECIKTLDFSTRWSLRSTSRTERALVDSQKLFLNELHILSDKQIALKCDSYLVILRDPNFEFTSTLTEKLLLPLKYILEHGVIEILKIAGGGISDSEYEKLGVINKSFSVKKLKIQFCENSEIAFWIKRMNDRIERIEIDEIESMDDIMDIPIISNVHFFQIGRLVTFKYARQLAQNWINNDAEIGREFQAGVSRAGEFALFSSHFQDRILFRSQTPKFVRIRTENPMKHILLEQVLDLEEYEMVFGQTDELLRMSVIPANFKEEEMDDTWILDYVMQSEDSSDYESDDSFDSWVSDRYNPYENYDEDYNDPYYDSDGYRQW